MGLYIKHGPALCKDINKPSPSWVVGPIIDESPRATALCSRSIKSIGGALTFPRTASCPASSLGHYKGGKMKYWLVKKEKGAEYNYTHIISKLLTKQGWLRVPWFVSWKEKPDGR